MESVLDKRVFKGLGLGALLLGSLIILLLILYHFMGSRPAPVPTGKLEVKPQTLPGVSAAPGTPPPLAAPIAPPLEPSPAPPGGGVGISGTTVPTAVQNGADEIVGWNRDSIVSAIRRRAL